MPSDPKTKWLYAYQQEFVKLCDSNEQASYSATGMWVNGHALYASGYTPAEAAKHFYASVVARKD